MMQAWAASAAFSTDFMTRREPGIPWKPITGVPVDSPYSAYPKVRPSFSVNVMLSVKLLTLCDCMYFTKPREGPPNGQHQLRREAPSSCTMLLGGTMTHGSLVQLPAFSGGFVLSAEQKAPHRLGELLRNSVHGVVLLTFEHEQASIR